MKMKTLDKAAMSNDILNRQHSRGIRFRISGLGRQAGRLRWVAVAALGVAAGAWSAQAGDPIQKGEMAGYLLVPNEKVPETYNAGFSMYVAAWPLLDQYPGERFQTGLFGTWMFARNEPPPPIKLYSDVEGGLGWWRDTEFATETPKFIMGGVAPNFSEWANGPGAGKGRDWEQPKGKYGVAQLSPWLLWPPDGLNLKQGTCGELFGYGYLPLPLTPAKATTAGKDIPTGDQSWTLFLNTGNFKGPVVFFTPYFWSAGAVAEPRFSGMLLDSRPWRRAMSPSSPDKPRKNRPAEPDLNYETHTSTHSRIPSGHVARSPLCHGGHEAAESLHPRRAVEHGRTGEHRDL
jgi:hypothetical protein